MVTYDNLPRKEEMKHLVDTIITSITLSWRSIEDLKA